MVERLVLAALGVLPAGLVGRTRTMSRGGTLVGRLAGLALRPLDGKQVPVRTGPARGLLMRAEPRSFAWLTGKVEPEVQRALGDFLAPGATFVDGGASVGFYSLLAARLVGPDGSVLAFEPSPADAAAIRRNASLNGFGTVTVVEHALSSVEGDAFLDRPGEATAALTPDAAPGALPVTTTTLDAFLAGWQREPPALVKLDVEGHEVAALKGMARTLSVVRPALVIEVHGDRAVVAALAQAGYSTRVLEPRRAATDVRSDAAHVLAVPRERR